MKTVVVTGGTTRLGKVIANQLEALGWQVLRSSHRPNAGADLVFDLSQPGGADALFEAASAELGHAPDAVVNNAAVFAGCPSLNVDAPIRLMELMAASGGAVVNILDCRVLNNPPTDAYSRDKFALTEATRAFAKRLRVNGVAPGPVLAPTDVHEKAGETPFGRPTPQAVADAVAFLLEASATSGCIIPVDGGQSLCRGV